MALIVSYSSCLLFMSAKGQGAGSASPSQLQLASRGVRSLLAEFGGLTFAEIKTKICQTTEELSALTDAELKHVLLGAATHVK